MRTHISVLGWLFIVLNAVHLLLGLGVWLFFAGLGGLAATQAPEGAGAMALLMTIGTFVLGIFAVLSLPGIVVGWGLLQKASWARIAGIVMSFLLLFSPPLGTALGIYGLVILFQQETALLFENR